MSAKIDYVGTLIDLTSSNNEPVGKEKKLVLLCTESRFNKKTNLGIR